MYLVGLTGGIGSGKSTVAARFAELGAVVIDADSVAREVVAPGQPALDEIVRRFGPDVLDESGSLDRPRLASIVFHDPAARADLEDITHPRIRTRITERIVELLEDDDPDRIVVIDHPLLVETGQARDYPAVVVVVAPEDVRVRRLVEERGMDPEDARSRIATQASDEERRALATHVIDNGGDLRSLRRQVDAIWADLLARARQARSGGVA